MIVSLLLAATLDVHRYSLRIDPAKLEASVAIEFEQPQRRVELSAIGMAIRGVTCGRVVDWTYERDLLRFDAGGARRCSIDYRATPGSGLTAKDGVVYTVFHTGRWMPSNPDLADRALFEVTGVPIASSNEKSFPAYLHGFASGDFSTTIAFGEKPRIEVHATSLSADQLRTAFATVPEMVKFFEERSGVAYPLSTYKQIVLDGAPPQEIAGGTLLSTAYVKSVLEQPTEDYLIAHELSHSWWGNLVTAPDWSEFWLHEGFATFMTAAWKEHHFSADAYAEEMALAAIRLRRAWATRQVPLVTEEASKVDRALIYSRGALVLHLLRRRLGEEAFWKGVRRFTRDGAKHPVTSRDLRAAFALGAAFDQWTERAALPDVRLSYADDQVTVEQQEPLFDLALRLVIRTSSGEVSRVIRTRSAKTTIALDAPAGELTSLFVDGADAVLGTFAFPRPAALIAAQLREPDRLTRLGAIDDAVREDMQDELARVAADDPSPALRRAAAAALGQLKPRSAAAPGAW